VELKRNIVKENEDSSIEDFEKDLIEKKFHISHL